MQNEKRRGQWAGVRCEQCAMPYQPHSDAQVSDRGRDDESSMVRAKAEVLVA
jgi:hypothetical protein